MQRILEPELMDDPEQALAYHQADFSASHGARVALFRGLFPQLQLNGAVLDLGCGSGDVLLRFARAFPDARFVGVDGSQPMLQLARQALAAEPALQARVSFQYGIIPDCVLPAERWQLIMSHSLLHQLHRPQVLWQSIAAAAAPGCAVLVADLRRPGSLKQAQQLVDASAGDEPEVLRRDFYNSLCAAFEPQEIRAQLDSAGLRQLQVQPQPPHHVSICGLL
ncbi:MAG TPA: methyltransferase domain-containing protein [Steroidobacteraceae bacterium]|jgi:SAM-dependent methyltransferase